MNPSAARTTANLILIGAGAIVGYHVVTTPPLRRLAWQIIKTTVATRLPAYLWSEVTAAWEESAARTG
jgi:hypothetical protein